MEYYISILGDSGCGKSSFIRRLTTGDFIKVHIPSVKGEKTNMYITTNIGRIYITFIEGLITEQTNAVIQFYSRNFSVTHFTGPIVYVFPKDDINQTKLKFKSEQSVLKNHRVYSISSKSMHNIMYVLLDVLDQLTGKHIMCKET